MYRFIPELVSVFSEHPTQPCNMSGNLATLPVLPRDEAFAVTADFNADDNIDKVSLGAGVYRDEKAKPWVLPSVREVSIFSSYRAPRNCEG